VAFDRGVQVKLVSDPLFAPSLIAALLKIIRLSGVRGYVLFYMYIYIIFKYKYKINIQYEYLFCADTFL
jgi:hypothetical protein